MSTTETRDGRIIEAADVADHCDACGWTLAVIVEINGEWECFNCGNRPDKSFEVVR